MTEKRPEARVFLSGRCTCEDQFEMVRAHPCEHSGEPLYDEKALEAARAEGRREAAEAMHAARQVVDEASPNEVTGLRCAPSRDAVNDLAAALERMK